MFFLQVAETKTGEESTVCNFHGALSTSRIGKLKRQSWSINQLLASGQVPRNSKLRADKIQLRLQEQLHVKTFTWHKKK
jgi:hypothetical protein